ncbi:hypothetical protein AB4254_11605 [Vibrio breoganii]
MNPAKQVISASVDQYGDTTKKLLEGYAAAPNDLGGYTITRPDGSVMPMNMKVGDVMPDGTSVQIDSAGNLIASDFKVYIGNQLDLTYEAKRSKGESVRIFFDSGKSVVLEKGDVFQPYNAKFQGLDEHGNLAFDGIGKTIKLNALTKRISLKVFRNDDDTLSGNIGEYVPGQEPKRGAHGRFVQAIKGKPAQFLQSVAYVDLITAEFYPSSVSNSVDVRLFKKAESIELKRYDSALDKITAESHQYGLRVEDNSDYVRLKEQRDAYVGSIPMQTFGVFKGFRLLGISFLKEKSEPEPS